MFCLCDSCKGKCPHPPPIPPQIASTPTTTLPTTTILTKSITIARNADQLHGITCFGCDKKKEKKLPPGQDTVTMGTYRTIKFCQKGEIREPHTRKAIEKAIDDEMEYMQAHGYHPIDDDDV
jgi:hypothetical protein